MMMTVRVVVKREDETKKTFFGNLSCRHTALTFHLAQDALDCSRATLAVGLGRRKKNKQAGSLLVSRSPSMLLEKNKPLTAAPTHTYTVHTKSFQH
jgi:hypothetical protein